MGGAITAEICIQTLHRFHQLDIHRKQVLLYEDAFNDDYASLRAQLIWGRRKHQMFRHQLFAHLYDFGKAFKMWLYAFAGPGADTGTAQRVASNIGKEQQVKLVSLTGPMIGLGVALLF